jgi:Domain of unknown function (DUF1707)
MPAHDTQSRARRSSPLYPGQHLRVSDAERQTAVDQLAEHFGAGRLDHAEFDQRVGRAMAAKTQADLAGLFDDLPGTGAPAAPVRPRRRHPVLLLVLAVILAAALGHALLWIVVPLLWIAFPVAVVLFVTGHLGRPRPHEGR